MSYCDLIIECPFCEQQYRHSEFDELQDDGDNEEKECTNCHGIFEVTLNIDISYDVNQIQNPPDKENYNCIIEDCPGQMLLFE